MLEIPPILNERLAGRYVLKREIGRGGAAAVYLAHDLRHERLVAIKVLHPELSHALGAQRFLREIRLTASLQHPHILPIHDSGEVEEQLFYVMPYVEGDSMRQRLGADNRLSIEEAVRIGREVAGALAYAHERGVVHRDIKPENILFSGGHAVLADFGIARAINRAHEKITQSGTITGTPAYMSPEQARDRAFDGRSDVYSLACVLYEAIAGIPPFVGETPQILLTQRISRTPPLLREYRYDVPAPIEAVIAKALSISPDDRFDDARAFSAALSGAIGHSGETLAAGPRRRPLRENPWLWAAGIALLVAGGAATSLRARDQIDLLTGRIDTAQVAIVPFEYAGAPAPAREQEPVAQGVYAAMREWNDIKLASDMSVLDALGRSRDHTLDGMMAAARAARSGKLVWGRVWITRDSLHVRAALYDAVNEVSLREVTIAGPRDMLDREPGRLRTLTADLLRLDGTPAAARDADVGTRSLAAWRAGQQGQRELARWRVAPAIAAFERAVAADPEYALPHVWLAQLFFWRGAPATKWAEHAGVATRFSTTLGRREQRLAAAMQALQHADFAAAATAYAGMRAADSLDAAAWLGIAYAVGMDRSVLPSRRSPSGFVFRGSSREAQEAFTRALQLAPESFNALPFSTVRELFVAESGRRRRGVGVDGALFFGFPDVVADTLAYVAYPVMGSNATTGQQIAPHRELAITRNREALLGLLAGLTQRIPENPDVFESLALLLETRDEITGTPNGGYSALSALERARLLATDSLQRARLTVADVRLHLKLGDFSRAHSIADSLLNAMPGANGEMADLLSGVAAFVGREHDAVALQRAGGRSVTRTELATPLVPALDEVATTLFMRAALGVCDDSLRTLQRRLDILLESYVSSSQRDSVSDNLKERPYYLALGCLGPSAMLRIKSPHSAAGKAAAALARDGAPRARAILDSAQRARLMRPGDFALDYGMAEAWLLAATGDTAAATRRLDLTLTALPTLSQNVLAEPAMAAAVARSMAFRAELAARLGDRGAAALWAGRVLTLWSHPDPSVAPTIMRMKALAAQRP